MHVTKYYNFPYLNLENLSIISTTDKIINYNYRAFVGARECPQRYAAE